MITEAQIIADVLRRELAPDEPDFAHSRARLVSGDRGGLTRAGITARSWGQYKGWSRDATRAEMDALTEADALAFYTQRHVRPFDGLPDPLRVMLIDFGVMSHHLNVWKAVQRAMQALRYDVGPIDGVPGRRTRLCLDSAWRADARQCYLTVLDERRRYYQTLAADAAYREFLRTTPTTQARFRDGWDNRVWSFVYQAP